MANTFRLANQIKPFHLASCLRINISAEQEIINNSRALLASLELLSAGMNGGGGRDRGKGLFVSGTKGIKEI